MNEIANLPLSHTLDIFGQYGGLIGLIIAALFLLLAVVLFTASRSRDAQTRAQNEQIAGFTTAIAAQTRDMSEAIRVGLSDQAREFVNALAAQRAAHAEEVAHSRQATDRLLATVERLTLPRVVPIGTDPRPAKRSMGRR